MKSPCSSLFKVTKMVVITIVIWMIWRMRNHSRFQDPIAFPYTIFQIKELACMVWNKFKKCMSNIVSGFFFVLKICNIQTRKGRVVSFMDVI